MYIKRNSSMNINIKMYLRDHITICTVGRKIFSQIAARSVQPNLQRNPATTLEMKSS